MFNGFPSTCDTPRQTQYDQQALGQIQQTNQLQRALAVETVRSLVAQAHEAVVRPEKARASLAEDLLAVRASMPMPPTSGQVGGAPSQTYGEVLDSLRLLIASLESEAAHLEQLKREIRI